MIFAFGTRSKKNLKGVHEDLLRVLHHAIEFSSIDFLVLEGLRTKEQQRINVSHGVSWTMNSRHLTGHAVDLAPWVDNKIDWNEVMFWRAMGHAVCRAAHIESVPIIWGALRKHGGDWKRQNDAGHFELDRLHYP